MNKFTTDYSNAENFYHPAFAVKTCAVDVDFKTDGAGTGIRAAEVL